MKKIAVLLLSGGCLFSSMSSAKVDLLASPERCQIEKGTSVCTSEISFSSESKSCLWVSPYGGGTEKLVSCAEDADIEAPYINKFGLTFTLREGISPSGKILDSVDVIGEAKPSYIEGQVNGVRFEQLEGNRESIPFIIDRLYDYETATAFDGDACYNTLFDTKLKVDGVVDLLSSSDVNWVQIPLRKSDLIAFAKYDYQKGCRYPHDNSRANPFSEKSFPSLYAEYTKKLNILLSKLDDINIKVELILSGDYQLSSDITFFESVIKNTNKRVVKVFSLGENVDIINKGSHEDWLKSIHNHFTGHDLAGFRNLSYSFNPVAYESQGEFKQYVKKAKDSFPKFNVIPISIEPDLGSIEPDSSWNDYSAYVKRYIDDYDNVMSYKPLWLSSYNMPSQIDVDKQYYRESDQWSFYSGLLAETKCYSGELKERVIPTFANHAGQSSTSESWRDGLFKSFTSSGYVNYFNAWNVLSSYNKLSSGCP